MGLFHRKPRVRPDIIIKHVPFDVPGEKPRREPFCTGCGEVLDSPLSSCVACRESDHELFASMARTNLARGPLKIITHASQRVPIGVTANDAGEWEAVRVEPLALGGPPSWATNVVADADLLSVPLPTGPVASPDVDDLRAVIAEHEPLRNKE